MQQADQTARVADRLLVPYNFFFGRFWGVVIGFGGVFVLAEGFVGAGYGEDEEQGVGGAGDEGEEVWVGDAEDVVEGECGGEAEGLEEGGHC